MTIQVWHWTEKRQAYPRSGFCGFSAAEAACIAAGLDEDFAYELVATVDTTGVTPVGQADFDHAYELTNSFDRHWSQHAGVTAVKPGQGRSTSMGDMLVCVEDGLRVTVASCGFEPVMTEEGYRHHLEFRASIVARLAARREARANGGAA